MQTNEEELFLVFFGARYPARQKTLFEKYQSCPGLKPGSEAGRFRLGQIKRHF